MLAMFISADVGLLWLAARRADLELDDPNAPVTDLPLAGPTLMTGLYYLLPIVVLVWCLMVERLSPDLSAYRATVSMIFIQLNQDPPKVLFRRTGRYREAFRPGLRGLIDGLVAGARYLVGIAAATGVA